MQSDTIVTAPPGEWRHPDDYPPPRGKIILILSRYGVAVKGKWMDDDAAWMPLPKVVVVNYALAIRLVMVI